MPQPREWQIEQLAEILRGIDGTNGNIYDSDLVENIAPALAANMVDGVQDVYQAAAEQILDVLDPQPITLGRPRYFPPLPGRYESPGRPEQAGDLVRYAFPAEDEGDDEPWCARFRPVLVDAAHRERRARTINRIADRILSRPRFLRWRR